MNGDTQIIDTIITCWAWVTSGFDLFGQFQAARSLVVQALVLVAAPLGPPCPARFLNHRVSRIDYSGNCCIEPNLSELAMLCFKKK